MGRFAPTPSGDLHLGSLYTAVAGYLDARKERGRWLLRIEDLDRPREVPGSADGMLRTLEAFGFQWDGEVVRQRDRLELYAAALQSLQERDLTFACACSRLQLEDELRYPGTCRAGAASPGMATSVRLRVEPGSIAFTDRIQGMFRQDVCNAVGDFILRRRDRVFAYVLSVVVDDAEQGITHVVRGADLLDNTPRQIYLQDLLGYPRPIYAHVPVLTEPDGGKLAKSRRNGQVDPTRVVPLLCSLFALLGLQPPDGLDGATPQEAWAWAIREWSIAKPPRRLHLPVTG